MDNIYIIVLTIITISMFGTGFFVARQLRALENVPSIFMMFVERRLLFSFVIGFFMSLMLMVILGLVVGFTSQLFFGFLGFFLLATFCYHFGVTFGWGKRPSSISENIDTPNDVQSEPLPENLIVDNSLASVKIIIHTKKRWGFFIMEAFQWIILGLCAMPILSLIVISWLQNYLPRNLHFLVWFLVGGLVLYLLYAKLIESLEFVFDKEIIEIDSLSVRIEKYGSKFSSKKEYPAENIKKITALFSLAGTNAVIKRSPFTNSNMPAFMLWHNHGLKRYRTFGRAVNLVDAQKILEMVYTKFPQYKG